LKLCIKLPDQMEW